MTYYDLLQVKASASQEVIHAAYRALMKLHHPDTSATIHGAKATALNAAYDILSDSSKKYAYDRSLASAKKMIGDFLIKREIAEGGFGVTYEAEHILTKMPVCVKHCSKISAEDEEIMINEARAMWDLRHYSIPSVRNVVRLDDGSLALISSFIPGDTITQIIEEYKAAKKLIDPENVAWITSRLLNALSYLHHHGIVHGDLKPQNIIIQRAEHAAVLVDFGLSAIKPDGKHKAIGYTDVFAPPEQKKGKPLIPQIDYYSLGMTMIYMLNGGDDRATIAQRIPASTPDALTKFVKRLISEYPFDRPSEREDVAETFDSVRKNAFGKTASGFKKL